MSDLHRLFSAQRAIVPKGQHVDVETIGTIDTDGTPVEQVFEEPIRLSSGIWMVVIGPDRQVTFWRVADQHFAPTN